ncbi:hypothetical protein [Flavihumibacter profundi]|jgi:hypothetical protein|uniref:hypothetical protein n=1 Tax=Flavihumibacter profundi TaxID=2716883 RepID=UPI001CC53622|nr:hypothetical protein [Flavihumibacter profundi]MBZ5856082.1 hypothetical protein [Flavihumibacter profundi]
MRNFLLFSAFLLISAVSFGQSNKEDVDMIQAMFGKEKKDLVQAYMTIPEAQKTAFWNLYDQYEGERKALGRERIALIESYANDYNKLDDAKSSSLMNRKLKWLGDYTKLQKKYFDSMSKVIGGKQASKLFQLEDYLENNIRLTIQESIPFIEELDKTKAKDATKQ